MKRILRCLGLEFSAHSNILGPWLGDTITVILKGPGDAERKPKTIIIHPESPRLLVPRFSHRLMGNNKRIVGWIMHVRFLAVGSQ